MCSVGLVPEPAGQVPQTREPNPPVSLQPRASLYPPVLASARQLARPPPAGRRPPCRPQPRALRHQAVLSRSVPGVHVLPRGLPVLHVRSRGFNGQHVLVLDARPGLYDGPASKALGEAAGGEAGGSPGKAWRPAGGILEAGGRDQDS